MMAKKFYFSPPSCFKSKILVIIICFLSLVFVLPIKAFEYGCVPVCMDASEPGDLQIQPSGVAFEKYSGENFDVTCSRTDNQEFLKTVKKTPEWTAPNATRIPDDLKRIPLKNDTGNCSDPSWIIKCVENKTSSVFEDHMCSKRWTKNCTNPTDEVGDGNMDGEKEEKETEVKKVKKDMSEEEIQTCRKEVEEKEAFCKELFSRECLRDCKIEEYVKEEEMGGSADNSNIDHAMRWTIAECDRTWLVNCLRDRSNDCENTNKRMLKCHFKDHWPSPDPGCFPQVTTKCSLEYVWDCWRDCQLVTSNQTLTGSTVKLWPGRCTREYKDQCKESILEDRKYLESLQTKSRNRNDSPVGGSDSDCGRVSDEEKMFRLINKHVTENDTEKCASSIEMSCQRRCHINWILEGLSINLKESLWKNRDCRTLCSKMVSNMGLNLGEGDTGIYCGTHCAMEYLKNGLYESENRQNEMKIRFKGIKESHEGQYRCQVPGGSKARCFSLSVIDTARGVESQWATLSCVGNSTSTLHWSRPDSTIPEPLNITVKHDTNTNMNISELSIRPNKKLTEFGVYICEEKKGDKLIKSSKKVLYRVKIPDSPTIALKKGKEDRKEVTKNSANITVTVDESQVKPNDDGGSKGFWDTARVLPIIGYTVQYKLTHRSIWTVLVDEKISITTGNKEITLKGLAPATTYYLRLGYKNKVARGYYSDHIKFTTLDK